MEDVPTTAIIDCGSSKTKAGLSTNHAPYIFNTIVGTPKNPANHEKIQYFIGDEVKSKRDSLRVRYPVEYGCITNWDLLEKIFHFTFFQKLKVEPEECFVLLTENTYNPKANREKLAMTMFESYNVPGFYLASRSVLSLYGSGHLSGIVAESGDAWSETVPVYEGYSIRHAGMKLHVSGQDLTYHIQAQLHEQGLTDIRRETAEKIKEEMCYVPQDQSHTQNEPSIEQYTLPDGRSITMDAKSMAIGEAIFNPKYIGFEYPGMHEILHNSLRVANSSVFSAKDFCQTVLLTGGNTMFPGLEHRLANEILKLDQQRKVDYGRNMKVVAPPDRTISAWQGGSILASHSAFHKMVITKDEYDEYGPMLVHRKCVN